MAVPAIALYLAAAAGGAVAYNMYDKSKQKKAAEDAARQNVVDTQAAHELQKGRSYAVQLMVDPRQSQWGGVRDLATAAKLIQATFEQLGWRFIMQPKPREATATAATKLNALQPLEWVFTGTWMRDEKFQSMSPNWVGMAVPFPLPTT